MKKLLSFILALAMIMTLCPCIIASADGAITIQAEDYDALEQNGGLYAPVANETDIQLYEMNYATYNLTVDAETTYEFNARLQATTEYVNDGTMVVNAYVNDELVIDSKKIVATGDGEMTDYAVLNLGFLTLAAGDNEIKIEIPDNGSVRSIVLDYFELKEAMTVADGQHIEAENFNVFYKSILSGANVTGYSARATADELDSNAKLTNGTGTDAINAILVQKADYASYNVAVAETGYYTLTLSQSVQGMSKSDTNNVRLTWCDGILVPTFCVNGKDTYDAQASANKGINALPATPLTEEEIAAGKTSRGINEFGPYTELYTTTVYLNKGGNNIEIGFDKDAPMTTKYNGQPFQFDWFSLTYRGTEKTDDDKPNISLVDSTETTYIEPSQYDYEISADASNTNFIEGQSGYVLHPNDRIFFNLRAMEAGNYKVSLEVSYAEAGADTTIGYAINDGGTAKGKFKSDVVTPETATKRVGVVTLEEGVNTLFLETDNGFYFKKLIIEPAGDEIADPVWAPVKVNALDCVDFFVNTQFDIDRNTGMDRTVWVDTPEIGNGGALNIRRGDWIEYEIDIPKSGKYSYSLYYVEADREFQPHFYQINGGRPVSGLKLLQTEPKNDWSAYHLAEIAQMDLEAGTMRFRMGCDSTAANYGSYVVYLQFANIDSFDTLGARANSRELDGAVDVFRGTDTLKVWTNGMIDEATVNASTVTLKDENGKSIANEIVVEDNIINVLLEESLDYSTTYSLTIGQDVASIQGNALGVDSVYTFTTADKNGADNATGEVASIDAEILYEDITVSGVLKSSNGLTIQGRKAVASISDPNGEVVASALEDVTDANGSFEISFTIPTTNEDGESIDAPEGPYTIMVTDEYQSSPLSTSVIYFAESTEISFLEALMGAADADAVGTVLGDFEERLGYDLVADLANVVDPTGFYAHFVGRTYNKVTDFNADYDLFRAIESVRQPVDVNKVEKNLYNEETAAELGLSMSDLDAIGATDAAKKTAFLDSVRRIDKTLDAEGYLEALHKLVADAISAEYTKTSPKFTAGNQTVTLGRGVTLYVAFDTEQTDVESATAVVEGDFVNGAEVVAENGVTATAEGNKITFTADFNTPTNFKNFGKIVVATNATGSNAVKFTGEVSYNKIDAELGVDAEVTLPAVEKNITITVNEASGDSNISDVPSGGPQGSGNSKPKATATPAPTEAPTTAPTEAPGEYKFNDLDDAAWAEEYIYELLNSDTNIISASADKKFRPNDSVTREEFAKMLVLMAGVYDENAECDLNDLDKDAWYYKYVASAVQAGIVLGYENGSFGVGENITRQDMTVMLSRALGDKLDAADTSDSFADDATIADYAKDAVYSVKTAGIVNGVGDNNFDPNGTATRAMSAKVICEALKLY